MHANWSCNTSDIIEGKTLSWIDSLRTGIISAGGGRIVRLRRLGSSCSTLTNNAIGCQLSAVHSSSVIDRELVRINNGQRGSQTNHTEYMVRCEVYSACAVPAL